MEEEESNSGGTRLWNGAHSSHFQSDLNTFASLPASERSHVRALVIENLRNESSALFRKTALNEQAFVAMDDVQTHLPMTITDYTDFFSSYVHAQNVSLSRNSVLF